MLHRCKYCSDVWHLWFMFISMVNKGIELSMQMANCYAATFSRKQSLWAVSDKASFQSANFLPRQKTLAERRISDEDDETGCAFLHNTPERANQLQTIKFAQQMQFG